MSLSLRHLPIDETFKIMRSLLNNILIIEFVFILFSHTLSEKNKNINNTYNNLFTTRMIQ